MFHSDQDPDFSDEYLDEVLAEVKQSVKRRRGMTALPAVVLLTFGVATYFTLLQPSSAPTIAVGTDSVSDLASGVDATREALGAGEPSSTGAGTSSYEPDSSPAAAGAAADEGSSKSPGGQPVDPASYRSRVPIGFDTQTLTETATDLGPTSPPPELDEDEAVDEQRAEAARRWGFDPAGGARVGAPYGTNDPSASPGREGKNAAASESADSDNPSVGQAGSEVGDKSFPEGDGSAPVTIRIAPSTRVDDLSVVLDLAVGDPDGASAGACGSHVDWNDGTVTYLEGPCDESCSASAGDGAHGTITFRHTFAEAGEVQATAVIYTGEECYGDGATHTFTFSVPPSASN